MEGQHPLPDIFRPQPHQSASHARPQSSSMDKNASDSNWQDEADQVEADTCRICRGEAAEGQPLFYPCKCSGSIKYVHQDCLMEWLEHSQKKYCELCKTPFRFTKLYEANMPPTLPMPVFMKHAAMQALKSVRTWLRGGLVVLVWLVALPWIIRHAWSALFYLADGEWSLQYMSEFKQAPLDRTWTEVLSQRISDIAATGTCPASPLLAQPTGSALEREDLITLYHYAIGSMRNGTVGPLTITALDIMLSLIRPAPNVGVGSASSIASSLTAAARSLENTPIGFTDGSIIKPTSILSSVEFLSNFTRFRTLNSFLIKMMEGEIICVVVVVTFILVFLIREWVIQQQPGINMGAGFDARRGDEDLQDALPMPDIAEVRRLVEELQGLEERYRGQQQFRNWEAENGQEGQGDRPPLVVDDEMNLVVPGEAPLARINPQASTFITLYSRANGNADEIKRLIAVEYPGGEMDQWRPLVDRMIDMEAVDRGAARRQEAAPIGTLGSGLTDRDREILRGWQEASEANRLRDIGTVERAAAERLDSILAGIDGESLSPRERELLRQYRDVHGNAGTIRDAEAAGIAGNVEEIARAEATREAQEVDESWRQHNRALKLEMYESAKERESQDNIADAVASEHETFRAGETLRTQRLGALKNRTPEMIDAQREQREEITDQDILDGIAPSQEMSSQAQPLQVTVDGSQDDPFIDEELENWDFDGPLLTNEELMARLEAADKENEAPSDVEHSTFDDSDLVSFGTDEFDARAWLEREVGDGEGDSNKTEEILEDGVLTESLPTANHTPVPTPPSSPRSPTPPPVQETWAGRAAQWLWGDATAAADVPGVDDEHIVDDIDAEAPFVPVGHHHNHHLLAAPHAHADVVQIQAIPEPPPMFLGDLLDDPNDPEVIDEVEDFDGIMELVGMRGPVTGLIQNAVFGVVLIAISIFIGVWLPYTVGKLTLLLAANPLKTIKLPIRLAYNMMSVIQDLFLVFFGGFYYTFIKCISTIFAAFGKPDTFLPEKNAGLVGLGAIDAVMHAGNAIERVWNETLGLLSPSSEIPSFSAASHESLLQFKSGVAQFASFANVTSLLDTTSENGAVLTPELGSKIMDRIWNFAESSTEWLRAMPAILKKPETWVITLSNAPRAEPLDLALSYWDATDRMWAIATGYLAFVFLGAAYVRKGSPFSTSQAGREIEAIAIDLLNQAGGVLKVILIISIEMIVFPLYCGLLLDAATLPLFDGASLLSRAVFFADAPFTSMFVHWFVGTCYMFHFALFVSMCRKILRTGVLYFIRDPDDPNFHPVRDVLERNVATQLRKIAFSGMVYGALVLICLGGVVWSLAWVFRGVLPIHWSSNEPVLEFPIDLLFYNFLMPLAVKYFQPSVVLHAMYRWWFHQCAGFLRLSHFLLDERHLEEEIYPGPYNPNAVHEALTEDEQKSFIEEGKLPESFNAVKALGPPYLMKGRYVRAPASDMVRIPKDATVFLTVNSKNERLDGKPEPEDTTTLHGKNNTLFKLVYAPPWFRTRICLFIVMLWGFAAITGCGATLIPLVIGRKIFALLLPEEVARNDVYAFAMGANIFFGAGYSIYHLRSSMRGLWTQAVSAGPTSILSTIGKTLFTVVKLLYIYGGFVIVLPTCFALLLEFYLVLPLHSFFVPGETHTIHFVQSWTLGLLMFNLARRYLLSREWGAGESRAANALRRVVRDGYVDIDIALATRGFILPIVLVALAAITTPILGTNALVMMGWVEAGPMVYRNSYPAFAGLVAKMGSVVYMAQLMGEWRMKVRDEVYLIGERLHNYGEGVKAKADRKGKMPMRASIEA